MSLSTFRRSRIYARETYRVRVGSPFRPLQPAHYRSLTVESVPPEIEVLAYNGVVSGMLRRAHNSTAGDLGSTNPGFTMRTGLAVHHATYLRVYPLS
jgi:hypothetical protein